jgi:tetratricopeptide (TPR) repeat protein
MGFKKITDQDLKYLIEKAESYISVRDFGQALKYYDQLMGNIAPHPHFFKRRAFCYRLLGNMYKAIADYNEALKLDPDDGVTYWERGACYNDKPFIEKNIDETEKRNLLRKALKDYKSSIERIPTSPEAWLAVIDIDLCLLDFDDAISDYGACKQYITTKEYQVIRSWYGCLALTLAGDVVEEEDEKLLNDLSVRLKWNHWAFYSIDTLFEELDKKGYNSVILEKSKKIHQKFIVHFDHQPLSFNQGDK